MLFLLAFPGTTFARAGFPVFFLFFDHVLLLAIPLVALEAAIARRVLQEPWRLLMFHNPLGAPRMVPADRPRSGKKKRSRKRRCSGNLETKKKPAAAAIPLKPGPLPPRGLPERTFP